jgi:hypothetical protein
MMEGKRKRSSKKNKLAHMIQRKKLKEKKMKKKENWKTRKQSPVRVSRRKFLKRRQGDGLTDLGGEENEA